MRANELIEILTRVQKEELYGIMTKTPPIFHEEPGVLPEPVAKHFYRQKLKKTREQVAKMEGMLVRM